jgi:Rrf2 family protein
MTVPVEAPAQVMDAAQAPAGAAIDVTAGSAEQELQGPGAAGRVVAGVGRSSSRIQALRVPARVDDALRALLLLAAAPEATPVKVTAMSDAEGLSPRFLSTVLVALRDHGIVYSHRGALGGYWLARPASEITVADVYDAVDARRPVPVPGSDVTVDLWQQLESELRARLASVTVADLAAGTPF